MIYYGSIDLNKKYILCSFLIHLKKTISINQQDEFIIIAYKMIDHESDIKDLKR